MTIAEILTELETLQSRAAKGTWRNNGFQIFTGQFSGVGNMCTESTAEYVVSMQNYLPSVLAELRRLQGEVEGMKRTYTPRRQTTLCGSMRFKRAWIEWNVRLSLEGVAVYSAACASYGVDVSLDDSDKRTLDEVYKSKIDASDEIFVLDVGGYIGASTRSEIDHAIKTGKAVRYLSQEYPDWTEDDCEFAQDDPASLTQRAEAAEAERDEAKEQSNWLRRDIEYLRNESDGFARLAEKRQIELTQRAEAAEARLAGKIQVSDKTEFVTVDGILFVNAEKHEQVVSRHIQGAESAEIKVSELQQAYDDCTNAFIDLATKPREIQCCECKAVLDASGAACNECAAKLDAEDRDFADAAVQTKMVALQGEIASLRSQLSDYQSERNCKACGGSGGQHDSEPDSELEACDACLGSGMQMVADEFAERLAVVDVRDELKTVEAERDRLRTARRIARIEELNPYKTRLQQVLGSKKETFGVLIEDLIQQRNSLQSSLSAAQRERGELQTVLDTVTRKQNQVGEPLTIIERLTEFIERHNCLTLSYEDAVKKWQESSSRIKELQSEIDRLKSRTRIFECQTCHATYDSTDGTCPCGDENGVEFKAEDVNRAWNEKLRLQEKLQNANKTINALSIENNTLKQIRDVQERDLLKAESDLSTARKEAFEEKWLPIESAPKGKTILGAYLNSHNKWRRVVMHYYGENEVENCGGGDEDYLAAGWYEMCESQDEVYRTEEEPIYWQPLPQPPIARKEG